MREKFDDFDKQRRYILRFMKNSTNVQKICQICGKPAILRHNKNEPYKIQLLCDEHRKGIPNGEMSNKVPLIDLKEHVMSPILKSKLVELDDYYIEKIKSIFNSNYNRQEVLNYLEVSPTIYNKLINQYKNKVDKNIKAKLTKHYSKVRKNTIKSASLNNNINNNVNNNLSKLKAEKGITNDMIVEKSSGEIKHNALSLIANGKSNPTCYTKSILAEVFECSIKDIFPDDYKFDKIYGRCDYIKLCKYIQCKLNEEIQNRKKSNEKFIFDNLANNLNISVNKLRDISRLKYPDYPRLTHDDIVKYLCYFKNVSENDLDIDLNIILK